MKKQIINPNPLKQETMNYYHYTKGCHLPSIVKEGMIKTSNILLDKKEKPAAWLTKNPNWDVACNIGIVNNMDDLTEGQIYSSDEVKTTTASNDYMKKEIGMCRIVISHTLPVTTWAKFKYVSGVTERSYYAVDKYSRSVGSPVNDWVCTFKGIPKKYWEGIEMYVGDQWVKWDEETSIHEFINHCLSCNGNKSCRKIESNGFPIEHCQKQVDFMEKYNDEIIEFWNANKHKKGYIQIYIKPDYEPYDCGFKFIEKRIRKSSFKPLLKSETNDYALVHFLWEATYTQYKMALAC